MPPENAPSPSTTSDRRHTSLATTQPSLMASIDKRALDKALKEINKQVEAKTAAALKRSAAKSSG